MNSVEESKAFAALAESSDTESPMFLVIDCFCGAGGVSTGFRQASVNGKKVAKVVACVNHDVKAIRSHSYNHPDVTHFHEDIRKVDMTSLIKCVRGWQLRCPDALVVLWASLECTNFSRAKAGKPKNADSRTLAEHLYRYIEALNPSYILIENVVEFRSWGPLDADGKPIDRENGQDWVKWREHICRQYGYCDCWRELNSANFGAHTSRNRLFGLFAKRNFPILFPDITHSRTRTSADLFTNFQRWEQVRAVLTLEKTGKSIFARKKPLSDKTLERIYIGLHRFVNEKTPDKSFFLTHYYGKGFNTSIEEPLPTITTKERAALVTMHWGETNVYDIHPTDSSVLQRIKQFMSLHGLADISIRMLFVEELLQAQGFPLKYQFEGTSTDQIKFIGNSVVPVVVKKWIEAIACAIMIRQSAA